MRATVRFGTAAALALCMGISQAGTVRVDENSEYRPTGKGWGELVPSPPGISVKNQAGKGAKPQGSNGINYHGGPVMTNGSGVNVYLIWYGNWSGNSATTILTDLAQNIAPSPYYRINTTYYDGSNAHVVNAVTYAGSVFVGSGGYKTSLTDGDVQNIVVNAIPNFNGGRPDPNGVYLVLTSADVLETSGFCTQYCGWHTHSTISGSDIKYSFVGNPDQCPNACEAQTTGPNGNAGADGMASVIAHELEEAVTDPDLNAWYDRRGYENADKCAWTFGTTYTANGAKANMKLGTRDYLIQQNWVNASGGYCALSY